MIRHRPARRVMNSGLSKALGPLLAAGAVWGMGSAVPADGSIIYDRNAAIAYATKYANLVVADGWFWTTSGTCVKEGADKPVPTGSGLADGIGDDCAHFVSSCIGEESHEKGGGLPVPSPLYPTYLSYGNPSAPGLISWLLNGYGTKVSSVTNLSPGDVIGYDWDGNGTIDHCTIYMGNGMISAHSASHYDTAWNYGNPYANMKMTLVHIIEPDYPPETPSNISPGAGSMIATLTPTLAGSAFVDTDLGSSHAAAEWRVMDGNFMMYDSGVETTHLTSLTVPSGILSAGGQYSWQVRYEDNYGDWSSYSTATSFIVPEPSMACFIAGGMLLGALRRRRNRRQGE